MVAKVHDDLKTDVDLTFLCRYGSYIQGRQKSSAGACLSTYISAPSQNKPLCQMLSIEPISSHFRRSISRVRQLAHRAKYDCSKGCLLAIKVHRDWFGPENVHGIACVVFGLLCAVYGVFEGLETTL